MRRAALASANVVAMCLALASYWLAWVAHPTAGLSIAAVDFAEFPKFMPQVRAGELSVWREAFYMPLLVLGLALAAWMATARDVPAGLRWCVRGLAVALPLTPSVFNVLEAGEFQTQLRLSVIVAAMIAVTPLWRRVAPRIRSLVLALLFVFGGLAPATQFLQLKPSIDEIYRRAPELGPGFWLALAAFGALAAFSAAQAWRAA
ncbi:MAG: hypothetical protein HZB53_00080 [Chloroflexi bacterium]|nr:hypothetical protein [Chloroflexota bacterium]